MATDDEFESFRGSIADLDRDRERRIRSKFEGLRGATRAEQSASPDADDVTHLQLVATEAESPPSPRHRRPVLVGVAAAVVLLALVGTISLVRSADDPSDVASSIDDLPLSELATRAASRVAVPWPPGGILHGDVRMGNRTAKVRERAETLTIRNDEQWTRQDGSAKVRESSEVIALGPGTPLGDPSASHLIDQSGLNRIRGVGMYDELQSLPTNPDDLLLFAQATGVDVNDSTSAADWLGRMLSMEIVPAGARAAGFRALEQLGAVPNGTLTNYSGETSTAYRGFGSNGRPWVLLVDPVTTRVTGVALRGGAGDATFRDAEQWSEFGPQDFVSEMPN